jgi:hypothetical protein
MRGRIDTRAGAGTQSLRRRLGGLPEGAQLGPSRGRNAMTIWQGLVDTCRL